jgi:pyridoxine 5-phosphate synthase
MQSVCDQLAGAGVVVSLFIDPDEVQIEAAVKAGAPVVELHTGCFAEAKNPAQQAEELARIRQAAHLAHAAGLQVNAGHGLNFYNVEAICAIPEIAELNIGHSIIAQALFSGLAQTVKDLKQLIRNARLQCF